MKHTKTKLSDIDITKYSLYELCRWAALEEAVNVISEKCDEKNISFESIELKPLEILKYVDSATDKIYEKISTT
jgi:hypothetical protein